MAGGRSRFRRLLGCTLALLLITPVMATEAALAVGTSASTTSVAIAPDPVVAVQPAAVTATVAAQPPGTGTPTGTVQFSADNGVPIGRSQPVDAAGRATLTVAAHAGSHRIKAVYSGDASFDSSSGSAMFTVNKADTTTTIASSANPVAPGGTIDFTADVHVNAPSAAVPVGAVALTIDGVPAFGPFRPDASGRVVITLVAPRAPTTNRIGALYTGDPETNASFSEMTEVVATPDHNPASQPSVVTTPAPASPPAPAASPVVSMASRLAAMVRVLTAALRMGGTSALVGKPETLLVDAPGRLDQKVYSPKAPKSAAGARRAPRSVLIASARHDFAAAGAASIRLRVTAAGRRAIRKAKTLKLAIVTRFVPQSGTTLFALDRLTVQVKSRWIKHGSSARAARHRSDWRLTSVR